MQTKSYAAADADGIHTKNNMSPSPSEWGHKILLPGQYLIANHSNWTVTVYDDMSSYVDDSKQMDCDEVMSSLEKSLHNLSLDIARDDETYIASTNLAC